MNYFVHVQAFGKPICICGSCCTLSAYNMAELFPQKGIDLKPQLCSSHHMSFDRIIKYVGVFAYGYHYSIRIMFVKLARSSRDFHAGKSRFLHIYRRNQSQCCCSFRINERSLLNLTAQIHAASHSYACHLVT